MWGVVFLGPGSVLTHLQPIFWQILCPAFPQLIHLQGEVPRRSNAGNLKASKSEYGSALDSGGNGQENQREQRVAQPVRVEKKVGRNDPCPCGSGKKYKNCHGKLA